jgi:hypothetical protein
MKTVSEQIRAAALGPLPRSVDGFKLGSLSAWLDNDGEAYDAACEYVDDQYCNGFLASLPDNTARRTFLLLAAEAVA